MSSRPRSRLMAIALSLVPGWGHVYWGLELVGLSFFTAFAVAGFAFFNGLFIYVGDGRTALVRLSFLFLLGITLGAWVDILRRTSSRRVQAEARLREENLREGMLAYLRGDLEGARSRFLGCLKADPLDVEALFRLGVVCSRAGNVRQGVYWLKRTLKHDLQEKWRWEVSRELERLKKKGEVTRSPVAQRVKKETDRNPV